MPRAALRGAEALPIDGESWQVMPAVAQSQLGASRLGSRCSKRLADKAHKDAGWPGYWSATCRSRAAVRMLTGHASHQVDSMPISGSRRCRTGNLSRNEREEMSAIMMVRADRLDIRIRTPDAEPSRGESVPPPRSRAVQRILPSTPR